MAAVVEIFEKHLEEGHGLLQARPLDKDRYEVWSDLGREIVSRVFGDPSRELRDLTAARRPITVRFEDDPSYYLTQLGANLRREIKLVEKYARLAREQAEAAGPAAPPAVPVAVVAPAEAAWGGAVVSALEAAGAEPVPLPLEAAKPPDWIAPGASGKPQGAVVVVPGEGRKTKSRPARPAASAVYFLGLLAGARGAERVCALCAGSVDLPAPARGLRCVSVEEPSEVGPALAESLSAWGIGET